METGGPRSHFFVVCFSPCFCFFFCWEIKMALLGRFSYLRHASSDPFPPFLSLSLVSHASYSFSRLSKLFPLVHFEKYELSEKKKKIQICTIFQSYVLSRRERKKFLEPKFCFLASFISWKYHVSLCVSYSNA